MIIQCPNCKTRYHYEESRFGNAPAKKIRCTKCTNVFEIRNPKFEEAVPSGFEPDETGPLAGPTLSPDDFSLDSTMMGGGPRKKAPVPPAGGASPQTAQPGPAAAPQQQPARQYPQNQPYPQGGYPQGSYPQGPAQPGYPPQGSPYYQPPPQYPQQGGPPQYQQPYGQPQYPQQGYPQQQAPPQQIPQGFRDPRAPQTGEFNRPAYTPQEGPVRKLKLPDWERLSVAVITGPDAGRIFEIDKPRVIMGRANCDILLSDGEVSRQHAAIEVLDNKAVLVDLGSTNGTYMGDRRVTQADLENRTEFDIGATTLMFIRTRKDGQR